MKSLFLFFLATCASAQPLLLIHADASEVNGSTVTPGVAPAGFTGTVVSSSAGLVNFVPAQSGDGVYFLNCCTSSNNAYYKFAGASVGSIFDTGNGSVEFYLKSRQSYAQRQAGAFRSVFSVEDAPGHYLFSFLVYPGSFSYRAGSTAPVYYYLPAGQQDAIFGLGVTVKIKVAWDGSKQYFYLNDVLLQTSPYAKATPAWGTGSRFIFGGAGSGASAVNVSDDVIDEFAVSGPAVAQSQPLPPQTSVSALACSPSSIPANTAAGCTVSLATVAPAGGTVVTLSSNNVALTVAPSVTVAAGAVSASFNATAASVSIDQTATVTASLSGSSRTATIGLVAPVLVSALNCSTASCTVTLSKAAPAGGAVVGLSSNNTALTVPPSVAVPASATSASFNVTAATVSTDQTAIVTASVNGSSKTASIALSSQLLVSTLTCSTTGCTVTLSKAASTGGAVVGLASSNTALTVPPSVTVPASSTSASFSVTAAPVSTDQNAVVTASFNGSSNTASIALKAPVLSTLACSPTSLTAGNSSTCTVSISSTAAASGMPVSLSTAATGVTIPASVTVPASATSIGFTVTTASTAPSQTAIINATAGSVTKTASLTITTSATTATVSTLMCSPTSLTPGSSSTCSIFLGTAAPAGGARITLTATATDVTIPSSVTVAAGGISAQFTVATSTATAPQTVTVSATASNTKTIALTITGGFQLTSFSCSPTTIIPGSATRCLVYMNAEAPAGGLVANLATNSTSLSVPASVSIPATASIFQFYATAALNASVAETVTVTVTVQSSTKTATAAINPYPAFYFHGNNTEISSLIDGATVQPTAAPSNWTGNMTVRGSGYLAFDPISGTSGISLHNGGAQNTDTAFVNFSGTQAGQVFNSQGEISFLLKSGYSFVARQGLAQPNVRYAFAVYDDTRGHFGFYTYTSGSKLIFAFTARGITSSYVVPAGQEDAIFGAGKVANIRMTWTSASSTLYLNDQAVLTASFMPFMPNWTAQSAFTIGASSVRASGGGFYASDDAIADIKVR